MVNAEEVNRVFTNIEPEKIVHEAKFIHGALGQLLGYRRKIQTNSPFLYAHLAGKVDEIRGLGLGDHTAIESGFNSGSLTTYALLSRVYKKLELGVPELGDAAFDDHQVLPPSDDEAFMDGSPITLLDRPRQHLGQMPEFPGLFRAAYFAGRYPVLAGAVVGILAKTEKSDPEEITKTLTTPISEVLDRQIRDGKDDFVIDTATIERHVSFIGGAAEVVIPLHREAEIIILNNSVI